MRVIKALNLAKTSLNSSFVARELMKFHFGFDDIALSLSLNSEIKNADRFFSLVEAYKGGKPLEYITKRASFLGEEFFVDERVLIPRFETEILVSKVLEVAKNFKNPKICEIGTGSGVIAISLKKELKNATIKAVDISKDALEVARVNAKKFDVEVELHYSNLLDFSTENFDIIVSNPPYIKDSYLLDKWVLSEPNLALFGGKNGDEILKSIIKISAKRAKFLACEMGFDQKDSLEKELLKFGFKAEFYQDLAGFDRGFVAKASFE